MEKIKKLDSKDDFRELLLEMLTPLIPYYSQEKSELHIGYTAASYGKKAVGMEGFSRPLWGLVPFWAGGGRHKELEEIYRLGLAAGTNPNSPGYWGSFRDYDQKFVEMAAIAYGILMSPRQVLNPLTEEEQQRLAVYLNGINEFEIPLCNWQFFRILVNIALKQAGKPYDPEKLSEALETIESFYLDEGWYQDGDSGQKDYYVSFAIHFYSLVYVRYMNQEDPIRCERYKLRACTFAKQFIHWFDEDGAALPFGRSLTYRFSQAGFFSACLLAGIEPFPLEVMKGLLVRHLSWWLKQEMFDGQGMLTIGYSYPNLIMAERYNSPGSPYWAMKTFAFLMLPDDHPFWTVKPASYPKLPDMMPMKQADMLTCRYPHHTTAYVPGVYSPNGHGQIAAKYGKFAYDTKFGFSISKSCYEIHELAPDSMLAFQINGYFYVRRICMEWEIRKDEVYSKWSPFDGITVETICRPNEKGHIRYHRINSGLECYAYDCGFAVPFDSSAGKSSFTEGGKAKAFYGDGQTIFCTIWAKEEPGMGFLIEADPNTNLIHQKTLIPSVKYHIKTGETRLKTVVEAACQD